MRSRILKSRAGMTLIEVLVAVVLTGILTTATFKFYQASHGQALVQQDISDLQLICRNTIYELKKSLRMAGYKINSHDACEMAGDTLCIYMQGAQPVDTIRYFLGQMSGMYSGDGQEERDIYELRRQVNSQTYETFAECISTINYNMIDSANVEITVTAEAERRDPDYDQNDGYRSYSLTERVKIRNVR